MLSYVIYSIVCVSCKFPGGIVLTSNSGIILSQKRVQHYYIDSEY